MHAKNHGLQREGGSERSDYDAVVVGAGPNGLAAAAIIAGAGRSVLLLEAAPTIGGGARSMELTLPGFVHDVCSAIHPVAIASPCFRELPLDEHGLAWIEPPAEVAHPLDDGSAAVLERSIDATARALGEDAAAYTRLLQPIVRAWPRIEHDLLSPLFHRVPRHPFALARFGLAALRSTNGLARRWNGVHARALFAGLAAHAVLPFDRVASAAPGLVLGALGHVAGWPFPRGGAQRISDALASVFTARGGEIRTRERVDRHRDLPSAKVVLYDLAPALVARIAGDVLPHGYVATLQRFRYGPGVCKVDYALSDPIPWKAEGCRRAATVHVGGTFEEIADAERAPWRAEIPKRPFVLLAQHTLFDPSRAPAGKHTAWAYCHVPNGSSVDASAAIEAQIERFAPGFRDTILARSVRTARALEDYDANCVGGDVTGGANELRQILSRPRFLHPHATPVRGIYLCSASTPPGAGVHGMCGYHAARAALARELRD